MKDKDRPKDDVDEIAELFGIEKLPSQADRVEDMKKEEFVEAMNEPRNEVRRGGVHGTRFVVGTPPMTPVLRPLRQPLYDHEFYPAGGADRIDFYVNSRTHANGTVKTKNQSNMTVDSILGTPLEFDLIGFRAEFDLWSEMDDRKILIENGSFQWVFGANTVWMQLPLRALFFPEEYGMPPDAVPGGAAEEQVTTADSNGRVRARMTTPDRRARRITSNESFRMQMDFVNRPILTADVGITVYMLGILYAQL